MTKPLLLTLLLLTCSCGSSSDSLPSKEETIWSRGTEKLPRIPLYLVEVPTTWKREDSPDGDRLLDSRKALVTWTIDGLTIAVHNFPVETKEQRIPPSFQVQRWKEQFDVLKLIDTQVTPCGWGGFIGLCFEAEGQINSFSQSTLAWAMQLAPLHYPTLSVGDSLDQKHLHQQMRADYTIKIVGPPSALSKHKLAITTFANSLRLIQEIPES